jgi:hypothetical protein
MKRVRKIYSSLMRAVKEGSIPFGFYGPETCRWATPDEMRRFVSPATTVGANIGERFLSDVTPPELQSPRFQ